MTCRHCGAEIAANALICYRCGSATADPISRPSPAVRFRSWPVVYSVVLVLMVLMAASIQYTTSAAAPRILSWLAVGVALVIVLMRARRR